jgi:hypothetical protein
MSLSVAPVLVYQLLMTLKKLKEAGLTIILVEYSRRIFLSNKTCTSPWRWAIMPMSSPKDGYSPRPTCGTRSDAGNPAGLPWNVDGALRYNSIRRSNCD